MRGATALVIAAIGGGAGVAAADPGADAIARHADADVAALRAQLPGDAAVRCTLGAIYAARGDLPRASLYLEPCDRAALADELAEPVARARREVHKKLATSELSGIDVLTDPEGAWAEVDALPGERFQTPQMVWVPAGHHVVSATDASGRAFTNAIDTKPHSQGPLLIAMAIAAPPPAHAGTVDMTEDNAGESQVAPPPDVKHGSIIPCHYTDGCPTGAAQIADPLADGAPHAHTHRWRLGIRFGGGVFDRANADAQMGVAIAAAGSLPVTPRLALAARIDWSRHDVDTLGATAGAQLRLARLAALDVVAGAGARVAIQLADTMDGSRATLAGAAWLEIPLRATPLTLGVRLEQGLHDDAALFELGLDLR